MKVCVLLSGGMDSVTVFYEALRTHEVAACLSFDYGSKHNACEIPFAKLHADRHGIAHHTVTLDFMDRLFKSDLLRSGEQCVCDLQAALDCGQSLLSFHLKTLKEAGLVSMRREGRWGFYQLATETVEHAEQAIAAYRVPVAERRKLPVACCS